MTPSSNAEHYKNHRFPGEIISHGVWLYYRFPLSYRDVQELLFARGIYVTHEAIRQWCLKFGQEYANQLRRRIRELGRNYGHEAGGLKGEEDRREAPACLMRVSTSTT
jgi:putative transposase